MLSNFLKESWNPMVFRIFTSVVFIFMIFSLYFGSLNLFFDFEDSFVMFILWTLWWPFLYVTLFLFGRFWCGFLCPIGLANEFGNSLRKTKKDFLLKYGFIPFVVFFIIVFYEQASGLFLSAKITMFFLLSFFLFAFLFGLVLPRWGFCKHICPIGTLLGVFNRLSILGVRIDREKCEKCETKECMTGAKAEPCPMFNNVPYLASNKDCLICTNCIKNCPHDSANLRFVKPGEELNKKVGFNLSESLFIIALLGFSVVLTSRGTQMFRFFEIGNSILLRLMDFTLWIGLFLLMYLALTYIKIDIYREKNFKENLINGGYVFLPLVFSIMFFLIVFGFMAPLLKISLLVVSLSKYVLLLIGSLWSINIARNVFVDKSLFHIISILGIALFWILILIPGPLSIVQENNDVYIVKEGETVEMKSFSMGYDPKIIQVNSGESFKIRIANLDITHSFDIDELNIHVVLGGGETRTVSINGLEVGEYEYYCAIPGHKEAGMFGKIVVV